MKKPDVVELILKGRNRAPGPEGKAFAPANIALCKYWGKRDEELNLPVTSSLSVSLGALGSEVVLQPRSGPDRIRLNGQALSPESGFVRRAVAFLDLFRGAGGPGFEIEATNTIPTAAGFASSASGFAALTLALDRLYGWNLEAASLSILARLGSGSACRSIEPGFVEWRAGIRPDGMDSHGIRLEETWPDLRLGLVVVCAEEKAIGSRPAMKRTVETSSLYAAWPKQAAMDLAELKAAIRDHDFERLGRAAEANALAMHATMMSARPAVIYWRPESIAAMRQVAALREEGIPVYFTMDAGPNLKVLFERRHEPLLAAAFPGLQVAAPWG